MAAWPAGEVTFLFIDLVGSTVLWECYPEQMPHAYEIHDAALRTAAEAAGGIVYKAIAVYARPFWRDSRAHTELIMLDQPGAAVFDTSSPDGPGHLCLLVAGPEARTLDTMSADERQAALLGPLAGHLGTAVTQPVSWHEKSWHLDPYVGGGYAALPNADAPATAPDANDPVGPIHWAGTETAREHPGYVIPMLVLAVIAAPVVEEIVFRGMILRGFLSRMGPVAAIGLQGVLFGLAHFDPSRGAGNVGLLLVLATVGCVFGGAAYLTRRRGPTMIAHAILNGIAMIVVLSGWTPGAK